MLYQIHEVSSPHSWHSINNTNNNLHYRYRIIPLNILFGAIYREIVLPEGNCIASELTTELETVII